MTISAGHRSTVLTPAGAGAIGVVRVTGPSVVTIMRSLLQLRSGQPLPVTPDGRVRHGWLVVDQERIDDVVASFAPGYEAPGVDLCVHGGVRVMERLLAALDRLGAPLSEGDREAAHPWPSTSLVRDEIIQAMAQAKTARAVQFLGWQWTHLPAALDRAAHGCVSDPDQARADLEVMLGRFPPARTLIEGASVAITGPANAGKSTLFNQLLGRSAALASPQPGTTRDWVGASVEMDGVPITLVDTAGYQPERRSVVRLAIERSWERARQTDLCLLVVDGAAPVDDEAWRLWGHFPANRSLLVVNKSDLGHVQQVGVLSGRDPEQVASSVRVSALTGEGVDQVVQQILVLLGFAGWRFAAPSLLTVRQVSVARDILADVGARQPLTVEVIKSRLAGF